MPVRSSLNIVSTISSSPTPPPHKVSPASLYFPAPRPSTRTPNRPGIDKQFSLSSASANEREALIAEKIDSTLSRLFEKVDVAVAEPEAAEKRGMPVVRVEVKNELKDPATTDERAEFPGATIKVDMATTSDPSVKSSFSAQEEVPFVRLKTPVEEAKAIRESIDYKCCPYSSPSNGDTHSPSCNGRSGAAAAASVAALSVAKSCGGKKTTQEKQRWWMCKAHRSMLSEEDPFRCHRCTKIRSERQIRT